MDYCTPEQYRRFLHQVPTFERMLVEDGIVLIKYWYSVSDDVQEERFHSRLNTINHLLSQVPYEPRTPEKVTIPSRPSSESYARPSREQQKYVPDHAGTLEK